MLSTEKSHPVLLRFLYSPLEVVDDNSPGGGSTCVFCFQLIDTKFL